MDNKGFTLRKRLKSFTYAFNGIKLLIRYEQNAWIHCCIAIITILAGIIFGLSPTEWIAIIFAIGMVLAAEAINSSIETICDLISPEYNLAIKKAKDLAAGAVLILAIAAAIIGLVIFLPRFMAMWQ